MELKNQTGNLFRALLSMGLASLIAVTGLLWPASGKSMAVSPETLAGAAAQTSCQLAWHFRAPFFDPRTGESGVEGASASLIGNKIYVTHGFRSGDTLLTSIYDILTNTWTHGGTKAPSATVIRSELAGGAAFGKHYAIGGRTNIAAVEEFNPGASAWTTKAPLLTSRGGLGAASSGNKIYAIGGRDGSQFGSGTILSANEVFDPSANTWTALAPMPTPVSDNYAAIAFGGKIYVFGGATDPQTVIGTVQIYDIANNAWSTGAPMPTPRGAAMAGVIKGQIVVFGGFDPNVGNLTVTEFYNPTNDSWSAGPDMIMPVSEIAQGVLFNSSEVYSIGSGIFGASGPLVQVLTCPLAITSFSPANGPAGATITITGSNFSGASAVLIGGVSANFTVVSPTVITAVVPAGASSGPITVTTTAGTATSQTNFVTSGQAVTLQFSSAGYTVNENDGTATITVLRTGSSSGAVTTGFTTTNGSGLAGVDYNSVSGTIAFANGDASPKTFTVPIINNDALDGNRTVNLNLTNATGGALLGVGSAILTIIDDEVAQPGQLQFNSLSYRVGESEGLAVITVARTNGSNVPVTVDFRTENGTAIAGTDYFAVTGSLTFNAGVTSQTFGVRIIDDNVFEGDKTVNLILSNTSGGASLGRQTAVLNIIENDPTLPLLVADSTVNFGGVNIGETATSLVNVRNAGGQALTFSVELTSGSETGFFITSQPPTTTLAPGQNTSFGVGFKPLSLSANTLTGILTINSNGGIATVIISAQAIDTILPTVQITNPKGGETITAGSRVVISFVRSDNDLLGISIISYSTDGGQTFPNRIAQAGPADASVIWNVPDSLQTTQGRIQVAARDQAGNIGTASSGIFTVQKPPSPGPVPSPVLQVVLSLVPPPPNQILPPNLTITSVSVAPATIASPIPNANKAAPSIRPAADALELVGFNIYRAPRPPQGQSLPAADQIVGDPNNLVGSTSGNMTSFTDMVSTDRGSNFVYSATSFFGNGTQSGGSQPASTDIPVINNPNFQKGTIFIYLAGSFIAATGAVLIVNNNDSFPLQPDETGSRFTVPKKARGSGGKTIKKVIQRGSTVILVVKNPDGKASVGVMFTRTN